MILLSLIRFSPKSETLAQEVVILSLCAMGNTKWLASETSQQVMTTLSLISKPQCQSQSSHMITFWLENGVVITLRTSGTEPKIKYYTEYCAPPENQDWEGVKLELKSIVSQA